MSTIRVGMIRCDLHAMYYGILAGFKHDPLMLLADKTGRGHAARYYFYGDYNDPCKLTVPKTNGFELARVWDKRPHIAENMAKLFGDNPRVCDSFEEVSDDVDLVFISNCNGNGEDHLEFARPGLEKGVATFVDKPFAFEVKDVKEMLALAKENNAPVMSLSMLRTLPHAERFRDRFAELGKVEFATIKGGGAILAGQIHTISLAQNLFGAGVESVSAMGREYPEHVLLNYGAKADAPEKGVMLNFNAGFGFFFVNAFSSQGAIHSEEFGDYVFPYAGVINLDLIKKMVQTGQAQAPQDEMLECVAIAQASRLSQQRGETVTIKEVL